MADLSTLDPTQPVNSELALLGAQRVRDTRSATITSFGVDHNLTGTHKQLGYGLTAVEATATTITTGAGEVTIVQVVSPTLTNPKSTVWLMGQLPLTVGSSDGLEHLYQFKVYRGATLLYSCNYLANGLYMPAPTPCLVDQPNAVGPHTYKLTGQVTNVNAKIVVFSGGNWFLVVMP